MLFIISYRGRPDQNPHQGRPPHDRTTTIPGTIPGTISYLIYLLEISTWYPVLLYNKTIACRGFWRDQQQQCVDRFSLSLVPRLDDNRYHLLAGLTPNTSHGLPGAFWDQRTRSSTLSGCVQNLPNVRMVSRWLHMDHRTTPSQSIFFKSFVLCTPRLSLLLPLVSLLLLLFVPSDPLDCCCC